MERRFSRGIAVTIKCSRLLRCVAGAAIAGTLVAAAPASATVTIGQLPPAAPSSSAICSGLNDFLQPSVTGGSLYTAREAGEITSWSTFSSIGGATYTFKIFRRTSDPDVFQVISHAQPQTLVSGSGIRTFDTALHVESGDLIGFNVSGGASSCTFPMTGDAVLRAGGSLGDGESGSFSAQDDVRLNLSATLDPSNSFRFAGVARNRRFGTAALTVDLSNPGTATLSGKGIKKRHASKSIAVAGPVTFGVAPAGRTAKRLNRRGAAPVHLTVTFTPPGGDPSSQQITIKLKKRKSSSTTP